MILQHRRNIQVTYNTELIGNTCMHLQQEILLKCVFYTKDQKLKLFKLKKQIALAITIRKTFSHIALFNLAFKKVLTQAFYKK